MCTDLHSSKGTYLLSRSSLQEALHYPLMPFVFIEGGFVESEIEEAELVRM